MGLPGSGKSSTW
jgi:hypothetical protein